MKHPQNWTIFELKLVKSFKKCPYIIKRKQFCHPIKSTKFLVGVHPFVTATRPGDGGFEKNSLNCGQMQMLKSRGNIGENGHMWMSIHTNKIIHTYIRYLWLISSFCVAGNFQTCFKPYSMEGCKLNGAHRLNPKIEEDVEGFFTAQKQFTKYQSTIYLKYKRKNHS